MAAFQRQAGKPVTGPGRVLGQIRLQNLPYMLGAASAQGGGLAIEPSQEGAVQANGQNV